MLNPCLVFFVALAALTLIGCQSTPSGSNRDADPPPQTGEGTDTAAAPWPEQVASFLSEQESVMLSVPTGDQALAVVDEYVRKSYLVQSAFECIVYAPDDAERLRLTELGLAAGREFLYFLRANGERLGDAFFKQLSIRWRLTPGPTVDFVLGEVYEQISDEAYEEITGGNALAADAVRESNRERLYREKNCRLLGT